jgi:hypothetical protein
MQESVSAPSWPDVKAAGDRWYKLQARVNELRAQLAALETEAQTAYIEFNSALTAIKNGAVAAPPTIERKKPGPKPKQRQTDAAPGHKPAEPIVDDQCEVCGIPWSEHRRCHACTIGLGEGHIDGPGVIRNDKHYCPSCAKSSYLKIAA